ncbi:hypothetical protein VTL71DRAFT_2419 [Oculimacula yallundae]|uniref:Uncharacterized protein n=1 Tax=Oculimacula yallundae TaxID=86028 RepID=A0ABR4C8T2_9HELO
MSSKLAYIPSIVIQYYKSRPDQDTTLQMFIMAKNSGKGETTDAAAIKGNDGNKSTAPSSAVVSSSESGDGHSRSSSATALSKLEQAQMDTERLLSGLKASARSNNEAAAPSMPRSGLDPHASAFEVKSVPVGSGVEKKNRITEKYAQLRDECKEKGDYQGMCDAILAGNSAVQRSVDEAVAVAEKKKRDQEHMNTLFRGLRASNGAGP